MKISIRQLVLASGLMATAGSAAQAQFSLVGQLRTRTELRNGFGNLPPNDAPAAFFTSQRTRLTFGYRWDRIVFQAAVQDVRVWGQDAATIDNIDGNKLMVHEAWAELTLANRADTTIKFRPIQNLALKVGRQEMIYDDARLIGNLDWLQQGRRFDAALLKAQHQGWVLDLGVGFNQNTDAVGVVGDYYTAGNAPMYALSTKNVTLGIPSGFLPTTTKGGPPVLATPLSTNGQNQQFKAFQMVYLSHKFGRTPAQQTKFSALFFKDDFQKYRIDSLGNATQGYVYGRRYDVAGVNARMTYGGMLVGQLGDASAKLKGQWQVFAYGQSGKDRDGLTYKGAYYYGGNILLQKGLLSINPGYEVLSGNNATTIQGGQTSRFDPLYGTPHKFRGSMDYFYAGTGSPPGGLKDAFLKFRYTRSRLTAGLDLHYFALAAPTYNTLSDVPAGTLLDAKLGMEFDFITTYALNKFTAVEFGYSVMNGTNSLEFSKFGTMDQRSKTGTWAYLMLNIRPDFLAGKPN